MEILKSMWKVIVSTCNAIIYFSAICNSQHRCDSPIWNLAPYFLPYSMIIDMFLIRFWCHSGKAATNRLFNQKIDCSIKKSMQAVFADLILLVFGKSATFFINRRSWDSNRSTGWSIRLRSIEPCAMSRHRIFGIVSSFSVSISCVSDTRACNKCVDLPRHAFPLETGNSRDIAATISLLVFSLHWAPSTMIVESAEGGSGVVWTMSTAGGGKHSMVAECLCGLPLRRCITPVVENWLDSGTVEESDMSGRRTINPRSYRRTVSKSGTASLVRYCKEHWEIVLPRDHICMNLKIVCWG